MLFNSLVTLAVAAYASADSSASCSFDDATITEAASVTALGSCPTLEGTLEISGDALGSVNLGSVEEIAGDIHIFNSSSATDISFNSLGKISGSLSIDALTQLHVVDFSKLSEISDLSLISLPSLSTINLNTGVNKLGSLQVSDTALSSLQGLITNVNSVSVLDVNNNKNITQLSLDNLHTVKENLILSFNGDDCEISLDNLAWASNLTIQDSGSFSASNLEGVNGSLILGYNKFSDFALPLETVGSALQIFANDDLTSFDLSNLTTLSGELRIFNNSQLDEMDFDGLEKIKGAVNIKGSFSNFTLPSLEEVDGDFTVQTDNSDFSCSAFKKLYSSDKIEGHNFKCVAPKKKSKESGSASASGDSYETENFSGGDGSDSTDSSDSDSGSSSKSKAGASAMVGGGIVTIIFTTVLSLLI